MVKIQIPFGKKVAGDIGQMKAQKVIDLRGKKHHGNTAGKPGGYGVRNKLDERAEFKKAH